MSQSIQSMNLGPLLVKDRQIYCKNVSTLPGYTAVFFIIFTVLVRCGCIHIKRTRLFKAQFFHSIAFIMLWLKYEKVPAAKGYLVPGRSEWDVYKALRGYVNPM